MLTPFGKAVRRFRDEKNVTLKAMANHLGVPSSYLSAIEHGRKQPSSAVVESTSEFFSEQGLSAQQWANLAQESPTHLKLNLAGADDVERDVYLAVGREFRQLPMSAKEEIREFIRERIARLEH